MLRSIGMKKKLNEDETKLNEVIQSRRTKGITSPKSTTTTPPSPTTRKRKNTTRVTVHSPSDKETRPSRTTVAAASKGE